MVSPALTLEASATLVMAMADELTAITTGPTVAAPSLEEVTEAELFTVPQVALVVGEVMWTWVLAPPARSAGPKCSAPEEMLHPELELAFFFNDTATTEIYTLSLHDALPIFPVPLLDTVTT